jgi:hypothetical protein
MKLKIDILIEQTYQESSLFYVIKGNFLIYEQMRIISINKINIYNR